MVNCHFLRVIPMVLCTGISISYSGATMSTEASVDFGSSSKIIEMEQGWIDQPIKHDEKSGDVDLVVTLGQQTYPALKDFIADYASKHNLRISIEPGSCGVTAKKLRKKTADVGAYCCPPGNTDRLPGIVFHTIGVAPIALVTQPDNPVENLSLQEARDIFSGEIIKWSEVPSEKGMLSDLKIQPVARLHCKKRPGHWKGLLENQDMFAPNVREVGVIPDMITNVAGNQSAIGYETLYMLDVYKEKGELKALSIDGMHPSDLDKMIDASYPIYRTYSLTSWKDSSKAAVVAGLIDAIKQHIEAEGDSYGIVPVSKLRSANWKFRGDELVGEPDGDKVFTQRD
jgi:phosphate transport system substrate-binding protein